MDGKIHKNLIYVLAFLEALTIQPALMRLLVPTLRHMAMMARMVSHLMKLSQTRAAAGSRTPQQ